MAINYNKIARKGASGLGDVLSLNARRRREQEEEAARRQKRDAELNRLLAVEEEPEPLIEKMKDAAGAIGSGAMKGLDWLGTISRSGIREIAETANLRPETEGVSWTDVLLNRDDAKAAVSDMRETVQGQGGMVAERLLESGADPEWVKRVIVPQVEEKYRPTGAAGLALGALDTLGMALSDPLSMVGVGGRAVTTGVKGVSAVAGRNAGRQADDILANALRPTSPVGEVLDVAGRPSVLAPPPRPLPVTAPLTAAEGATGVPLAIMGRKIATIPGTRGAGNVKNRLGQTDVGKTIREGFVPFAKVTDTYGRDVSNAMSGIRQTRDAFAKLETNNLIKRQGLKFDDETVGEMGRIANQLADERMIDDVAELGRLNGLNLVMMSDDGKRVVAPEIADAIFNMRRAGADNVLVQNLDKGLNWIKSWTLFNPVSTFTGRIQRDHMTGQIFNITQGVTPVDVTRFHKVGDGVRKALRDDAPFEEALPKYLDGDDLVEGRLIAERGLIKPGIDIFEDVPNAVGKQPNKLLRPSLKVQELSEEHLRGSLYMKARRDGLDPKEAFDLTDATHLNYGPTGATRFERDYLKRIGFFYTFLRRGPAAIVRNAGANLGKTNAMNQAGLGFYDPDATQYNEYGEPIDKYLDTPLGFVQRLPFEFKEGLGEQFNPFLSAILNEDDRKLTDLIPPLGIAKRTGEAAIEAVTGEDPEGKRRVDKLGWGTLTGGKIGIDYAKNEWEADSQKRMDEKGYISKKDKLIILAEDAGVENPYDMTDSKLVKELLKKGVGRGALKDILSPKKDD